MTTIDTSATHRADWARQRAVDAVADRLARIAAVERELAVARRELAAAECALLAAQFLASP